jgi:uncharacterized membrane protein
MKKVSLYVQAGFYVFAGSNHFINPDFYNGMIPPYFPAHDFINLAAGVVEILLGIGLFLKSTRKWAAYGIIAMLVAFISSHWYFIEIGGCIPDGLCAPLWLGWVRLVVVHPMLMLWAWSVRKM